MIQGKSPTLLNVTYMRPKGKHDKEYFEVIYRDDNGTIRRSEEPAEVDIYFSKPEHRTFNYNKPEERMEKLNKQRVVYSQIRRAIAKEIGPDGAAFVAQCYQNQDYSGLDKLYMWPYSFRADFQAEFYFMQEWLEKYPLPPTIKLTKSFLDIEVDQIDAFVDMDNIPSTAVCPVNVVTVLLEETKECYSFLLRPYEPSRIGYDDVQFEKRYRYYQEQLTQHTWIMEHRKEFIRELEELFTPIYGHLDYHIREYEKEIDLIADVFRLINDRRPNFCLQWNMRFDIQYLVYRIKALGYDPADVICHQDFSTKECFFRTDRSTFMLEKQFDYFYCRSYTQYICQMRLYASIRKSQHSLKSVSLNYIGDRELRDKKVEYPNEMNFIDFAYLAWKEFVKYNIKDVLIQAGIERKTNDVMTYYLRAISNCTPYPKIFRETHLLRNVREMYFNRDGWVQGNNINILNLREEARRKQDPFSSAEDLEDRENGNDDDDDDKTSFKGAIMAEPTMNANVGIKVLGTQSNVVFVNTMDFDMAAFYPSIKTFSNMDPITLIGKASFDNDEFISGLRVNRSLNQVYQERDKNNNLRNNDHTGEAINTFLTGNVLTFGYNWLGYPSVTDLYRAVERELK